MHSNGHLGNFKGSIIKMTKSLKDSSKSSAEIYLGFCPSNGDTKAWAQRQSYPTTVTGGWHGEGSQSGAPKGREPCHGRARRHCESWGWLGTETTGAAGRARLGIGEGGQGHCISRAQVSEGRL